MLQKVPLRCGAHNEEAVARWREGLDEHKKSLQHGIGEARAYSEYSINLSRSSRMMTERGDL